MIRVTMLSLMLILPIAAWANNDWYSQGQQGWHFYEKPAEEKEKQPQSGQRSDQASKDQAQENFWGLPGPQKESNQKGERSS